MTQNAVFYGNGANIGDAGSTPLTNDIYQIDWRTSQRTISGPVNSLLRLGAGGIVSHAWGNGPIWLNNSSAKGELKLLLVADQAWHNNGEANANCSLTTKKYNGRNVMTLAAEPGVTLTLREKFGIDNQTDTTFGGDDRQSGGWCAEGLERWRDGRRADRCDDGDGGHPVRDRGSERLRGAVHGDDHT